VRLSYSKDPQTGVLEILDENHYYPFGLKHEVYVSADKKEFDLLIGGGIDGGIGEVALKEVLKTEYLYKYNGKEFQDELGLGLYDYGWRNYDSSIGRFFNMDRLSEAYYSMNPYQYTANNPVKFIDVNGEYIWIWDEENNKYKYDNGKMYSQNQETGNYDQEYTATEGSYVAQIQGYLNQIGCKDCENGRALLDFFNNEKYDVDFMIGEKNQHRDGIIKTNFNQDGKIFTTGSRESILTNFFTTIAHELGHAKSYHSFSDKRRGLKWYSYKTVEGSIENVSIDEVYALYIENLIRAENNLNFRTHYDSSGGGQFLRGKKGELIKEAQNILSKYFGVELNYFKK
jgi:RHS repeat-associated protein